MSDTTPTETEVAATPAATTESVVPAAEAKPDKAKDGGSWFGGCCGLSGDATKDEGKSTTEAPVPATTEDTTAATGDAAAPPATTEDTTAATEDAAATEETPAEPAE